MVVIRLAWRWPLAHGAGDDGDEIPTRSASFFAVLFAIRLCSSARFVAVAAGAVGILIAETFDIRSCFFHALNGAISGWIGWPISRRSINRDAAEQDRRSCSAPGSRAASSIGGCGRKAGFWKPVPAALRDGQNL